MVIRLRKIVVKSVLEARKPTTLVVAVWRGGVTELIGLSTDLLVQFDFGHDGHVVRSAQGRSLVAVAAFWIGHLLLLPVQRVLSKSGVVLHELQARLGIALVFGGRVVVLSVLGTHDPDNLSGFGFLRHGNAFAWVTAKHAMT